MSIVAPFLGLNLEFIFRIHDQWLGGSNMFNTVSSFGSRLQDFRGCLVRVQGGKI